MVIVGQAKFLDGLPAGEVELLVDFVLDGDPVRVPAKAPLDVVALHGPVSGDDIFNGRGKEVSIMWQTRSKGRTVIEGVSRLVFRQFNLYFQAHQQRSISRMCGH